MPTDVAFALARRQRKIRARAWSARVLLVFLALWVVQLAAVSLSPAYAQALDDFAWRLYR